MNHASQPIPQKVLALSRKVDECEPLMCGRGTGGGGLGGGSAANSPHKQRPGTAYGYSESITASPG
jgi:hypothetical protein